MKRFGKYSIWVVTFLFAAALIILYKAIDKIENVQGFLLQCVQIIKPFIIGFVIAYLLNIPCKKICALFGKTKSKFVQKHKWGMSILSVYLLAAAVLTVVLSFILPAICRNIIDLWNSIPYYFNSAMEFLKNIQAEGYLDSLHLNEFSMNEWVQKLLSSVDINQLGKYAQGVVGVTSGVFTGFMALIISIYMLSGKEAISETAKRVLKVFIPNRIYEKLVKYVKRLNDIFSTYVSCQLLDAVIIGTLVTIAFSLLKVKYALVLGVMIGAFNLIPYFGAIIACVGAIIITIFTGGFMKALWACIVVIGLQQIDANIIGPKIMSNSLKMSPLWVIFAVTVGGGMFGVVGMVVSVPVLAIVRVIFSDYLDYKEQKKEAVLKAQAAEEEEKDGQTTDEK
jgi:predicted PurR-regulated permease PerM